MFHSGCHVHQPCLELVLIHPILWSFLQVVGASAQGLAHDMVLLEAFWGDKVHGDFHTAPQVPHLRATDDVV
jgi:hypothetical protein